MKKETENFREVVIGEDFSPRKSLKETTILMNKKD